MSKRRVQVFVAWNAFSVIRAKRECIKFCSYKPCMKDDYVIVQSHSIWPSLNALSLFKERLKSQVNPNIRKSLQIQVMAYRTASIFEQIFWKSASSSRLVRQCGCGKTKLWPPRISCGHGRCRSPLARLVCLELKLIVDLILPAGRKNEKTTSKHPEKVQPEEELKALGTEVWWIEVGLSPRTLILN